MEYTINSVEIMITIPKKENSYQEAKEKLRKELNDPDFGDGLGYGLIKNYNLDEIDYDDEDENNYQLRIVYTY